MTVLELKQLLEKYEKFADRMQIVVKSSASGQFHSLRPEEVQFLDPMNIKSNSAAVPGILIGSI